MFGYKRKAKIYEAVANPAGCEAVAFDREDLKVVHDMIHNGPPKGMLRCPDWKHDDRQACGECGLVQHRQDTRKKEACRRCHAGAEPGQRFLDVPPSKELKDFRGVTDDRVTVCPKCHGVQPWKRTICRRCRVKVRIFHLRRPTFHESTPDMVYEERGVTHVCDFKCGQSIADKDQIAYQAGRTRRMIAAEDKVVLLEREVADLKHEAHEDKTRFQKSWETREGSHHRRIENVKRAAERKAKRLQMEIPNAQSVPATVETFMGMPVADAAEAMLVADELGRAVDGHRGFSVLAEIAVRFRKLRTPPTPKSRSRVKALTNYFCPECGGVAHKTLAPVKAAPFFCPKQTCAWEGEA